MEQYSTNLTDKRWQVIEKIINPQERKRKHSLRNIMNAILYLLKTGCQWRMIFQEFCSVGERILLFQQVEKRGHQRGSLTDWVFDKFKWVLEVVLRPDECPSKFKIIPKRWIVERAFAWMENFRRLTIDYESRADTAEAMVQLAFCKIMLNKIIV